MNRFIRFVVSLVVLPLLVVVTAGCGGENLATLSGKVTYKDKPVTGGTLLFVSEDKTRSESVQIKPDGTYSSSRMPFGVLRIGVVPAGKNTSDFVPLGKKDAGKIPKDSKGADNYSKKSDVGAYVDISPVLRDPMTSNIKVDIDTSPKEFDIVLAPTSSK